MCRLLVLMCSAGQSMNRWSLEELVKRDPENFIILLQQILKKTKEVREEDVVHCSCNVWFCLNEVKQYYSC